MSAQDNMPRRLAAASVSHGMARRIGASVPPVEVSADEMDHRLGFDLGYRDGLSRATAEAETAAIEARVAWEASARAEVDAVIEELDAARKACAAAAHALGSAHDDERAWATTIATEIAFAAVVRLLGARHAERALVGDYCAQLIASAGRDVATLRVTPEAVDEVAAHVTTVPVIADPTLEPYGCVIEGNRGQWRAGLRERLDLLRDGLLAALDGESPV